MEAHTPSDHTLKATLLRPHPSLMKIRQKSTTINPCYLPLRSMFAMLCNNAGVVVHPALLQ
ncbi:hypothetical protein [Candidatus Nitrosoglobus terrae]|uniref:hypothetical protein n=1 Tax=Candidatus Nitrosoglobus terrae TaxID=1630141 RepID=UPI0015564D83|nr:hypothetical protein [Candidatus Nitrosoglobus terrae]